MDDFTAKAQDRAEDTGANKANMNGPHGTMPKAENEELQKDKMTTFK